MRKLVYYIGVSLDGRIAGPHGEADFFPTGQDHQAVEYMNWVNTRFPETVPTALRPLVGLTEAPNSRFDTVIMGWNTYNIAIQQSTNSPYSHLSQYVATRSHAQPSGTGAGKDEEAAAGADKGNDVRFTRDATALVRELKAQDGLDIWLCGGGALAGALLPELDEMVIKCYPVVAGAGPTLVDGLFSPTTFTAEPLRTFGNGVIMTRYVRATA